jgi:hypothetical protein
MGKAITSLLGDEKAALECELNRLGLDPSKFLVEVRRESDGKSADAPGAIRYDLFITDLAHLERETCKLHGGHGKDWYSGSTEGS